MSRIRWRTASSFSGASIVRFSTPGCRLSVRREAFRPSQGDTTGLSVFRARFVQPADTLANLDPTKARDYYVARPAVSALRALGLTVVPEPEPGGPPGHAIIPELSWQRYLAQKQQWKPTLVE